MKNKIDRMKTRTAARATGVSTRTLAMVLCFVMLLTTIGAGTMMTSFAAFTTKSAADTADGAVAAVPEAEAAETADVAQADTPDTDSSADEPGLLTRTKDAIANVGANADLAATGYDNTFYFTVPTSWTVNNWTVKVAANRENDSNNTGWSNDVAATDTGETYQGYRVYKVTIETWSSSKSYKEIWAKAFSGSTKKEELQLNGSTVMGNITNKCSYTAVSNTYPDFADYKTDTEFYLSGYLGKSGGDSYNTGYSSSDYKMVRGTSDKNKWTISYTVNGTQYVTVNMKNDWGSRALHPTSSNAVSGTACGASDDDPNGYDAYKWLISASSGQKVDITYDTFTRELSWTLSSTTTSYYLTGWINGAAYSGDTYHFSGSGDNYTYTFTNSTTAAQYLTIKDNLGQVYHPASHPAANGAAYSTKDTNTNADPKWGITSGAKGKTITFTWKPTSKTLSWTISSGGEITVYAKDGAAPINWDDKTKPGATSLYGYNGNYAYNYGIIGTTTAESSGVTFSSVDCDIVAGGTSGSKYQQGSVPVGQTVKVTTTIDSAYSSKYYVAGWSVNGITYKNGTDTVGVNPSNTTDYSFTYTLPSDTEDMLKDVNGNPVLEITPIYYLKDKTNTVTFYLEGYSDVASKWGNTPYCYPFYGNLSGYQNTFGAYPGQPMVNVGGQISIEIPIYTVPISGTVATTVIKGVTVSNGYADHVHRNLVYGWTTVSGDKGNDKDHMQTYDYDDFYKIYEERLDGSGKHPNAIFFRIKEKTTKYNRASYGGGSNSGQFASGTSSISISTIASSGNGWELMKDRHDRNVNIFGDYSKVSSVTPSSATADTSKALYVVSTGYNANIAGDYGTMWKIYDGNGNLITKDSTNSRYGIPPSLLNLRGSASGYSTTVTYPSADRSVTGVGSYKDSNDKYLNIYKTLQSSTYANKIVYITYEKDTQDTRNKTTGEGAYRVDGKWFYTHASDNVTSTIGIEYYDRGTGKWVADTVSSTSTGSGTTTKAKAVFDSGSYASASNKTTSDSKLISANGSWSFTADEFGSDNTYAFSGWYLKYDDTYEQVTGSTNKGTINATANYQLIARYVPLATSSLVITHKLDPASTGTGTASMTVTYGGTAQTVNVVDGVARANVNVTYANKNIVVKLTTTPANDGIVRNFTDDDQISPTVSGGTVPGSEGAAVTKTLTFSDHAVYNSNGTSLTVSQLDYMSKIDATPHYYEFTYNFTDRDGGSKKYVTRGEITENLYAEYVDSDHNISDAFVKSRAPFESNFLNTLKLGDISDKSYADHTLKANADYSATKYTPVYDVKVKLPYDWYTTSSGSSYKKYNAKTNATYKTNTVPFTLKANYDEFVTIGATDSTPGAQDRVSKITDKSDEPNHTGNDFITAADTLNNGTNGTKYFKYWEIKRLADSDEAQATAPLVSRVYYPDLNYRIYCNSYVEAVYTDNESEYWAKVKANDSYSDISCSVLYLESSRNQWNMNGSTATSTGNATDQANIAADKIYNDFVFSYTYKGKEYLNSTTDNVEIGMVLERVHTDNSGTKAWAKGDSTVTDMDSYRTSANSATENPDAIADWLKNGGTAPTGCLKQVWQTSELNNKNYVEEPYYVYSAYGQTVADHSITFTTDSTVDDYVYRAWAYIIDKNNGNAVTLSEPAYFSMNYIAAQNYSE